jgi:hypothetical protein
MAGGIEVSVGGRPGWLTTRGGLQRSSILCLQCGARFVQDTDARAPELLVGNIAGWLLRHECEPRAVPRCDACTAPLGELERARPTCSRCSLLR